MTTARQFAISIFIAALALLCACSPSDTYIVIPDITPEPISALQPLPSPKVALSPIPSVAPAQHELTPAPSSIPSSAPPQSAQNISRPLAGIIIGLDPGHQAKANSQQEPVAPGSSDTKKKVSSGTQGRYSRVPEYEVVLNVGLMVRDLLEEQGATVVMTRETHDVDISNAERAQFFNEKQTDYALRIHCNGSDNQDKHGAFMLVPTENPYYDRCKIAAQLLIDEFCRETGAKNLGLTFRSDQTGFNWCERMIINIEMGHMTNQAEDLLLADPVYQEKMARGIFNGIMAYFAG